jgi:hypothetical protein
MILIYKNSMHPESQLNSALCGDKADPTTRYTWLIGTLRQLEQYPPTTNPPTSFNEDIEIEATTKDYNENKKAQGKIPKQQPQHP